jgi:hypothetical protein
MAVNDQLGIQRPTLNKAIFPPAKASGRWAVSNCKSEIIAPHGFIHGINRVSNGKLQKTPKCLSPRIHDYA